MFGKLKNNIKTTLNIEYIKNNLREYSNIYTLSSGILIFYYYPYLFFSILFIFSLYGVYTNINTDFSIEVKINSNKLSLKTKKSKLFDNIDFDKPIDLKED